ncbi:zinc-dependent peptidase [Flavobacterium gawalongense]|uniref:Zinc-dependent peptidase n=1 Tax=Flavobacterium gawalongense TaxID=2594432 RepID=A0A553BP21_9FLAO|nr:zinc-dependent peptidase [Flavobacterium gawalongense]TRW99938.1 zinc-dependent peptidase [Flavobacterium gawalongense]TRX04437.1 zinc-dependent peptidase [Flavobacterium gawalongense]TRX09990.1 zinc-dependent peptidase [Flavobacterium gawalongense]
MTEQLLISVLFGILFLLIIIFRVLEPANLLLFNKPLYIHWYPLSKKLKLNQRQILVNEFPFYNRLSAKRKMYFEHRVKEFISNYQFIGNEIVITEQMQMLIAGTYVMLTFGMRNYLVRLFDKIIIYPSSYYSTVNQEYHKGEFNPKMKAVIFSWEDFLLGHATSNDNINLGLHEFSHVLHFHCLKSNDPSAIIFFDEFNEVIKYYTDQNLNNELQQKGYFRLYAYENQFEFLSVILEHFFETSRIFKTTHPELYKHIAVMINFKEKYLN